MCYKGHISRKHLLVSKLICKFIRCLPAVRNLRITSVLKNTPNQTWCCRGAAPIDINIEMINVLEDATRSKMMIVSGHASLI